MKTLIITVGTRQVGWRGDDGIIRCFGADGDRAFPRHIDELYAELGIERKEHLEGRKETQWSVRDLGERYYQLCQENQDFSRVELLLDQKILSEQISQGLDHIILWGTDQPETVSWVHRRLDTLWLAQLMAGKIQQSWKNVEVDTWNPVIMANNLEQIRREINHFILDYALDRFKTDQNDSFTLLVETTGSTPAIASSLEICAAALVRQCSVLQVNPLLPEPIYQLLETGKQSANLSQDYQIISISEYFFPLEKLRIKSAWQRGDFAEAKLWLEPHQSRHKTLYQLAGYLADAANNQVVPACKNLRNWVNAKDLTQHTSSEQRQDWQQQIAETCNSQFLQVWESSFLIELALQRQNYTAAMMQFAQVLERLLYLQYQDGDWLKKGYITLPEGFSNSREYNPGLGGLILGWCKFQRLNSKDKFALLLDRIRNKRNQLVHSGEAVTLGQIRSLWADGGLFPVKITDDPAEIWRLMQEVLEKVCEKTKSIPDFRLLRSLYQWGLQSLS